MVSVHFRGTDSLVQGEVTSLDKVKLSFQQA